VSESDPFSAFESQRTIIKPSAGRGARPGAPAAPPAPQQPQPEAVALPDIPSAAGLSPLVQLAASLLITGSRIRTMPQHANPAGLRAALVEALRKFETDARARGLPNDQVVAGRYLLCTFLDECASTTPWGGGGAWSSQSLLVHFHNEAWGGEKLFQLLGKLAENVAANQALLGLIYVILALGFEGRYRVAQGGRAQLDGVREKLSLMLREQAGTAPPELSPHWAGVPATTVRLRDGIPVWVVAVGAALVLSLVFVAMRLAVYNQSNDAFSALQALDVKAAALPPPPPPPAPAAAPRLSGFLKPEIDAGLVEVRDLSDRSVIVIRGDGIFGPGSADVTAAVLPLLGRIGEELERVPGQILVTGHTDNQPIRSLRFPSNWQLSQDRARSVKDLLANRVKADRLRHEGLADTQPVADNATAAGRARNRRVEITLRPASAG
jgi:type VI secretion system protein ImpK